MCIRDRYGIDQFAKETRLTKASLLNAHVAVSRDKEIQRLLSVAEKLGRFTTYNNKESSFDSSADHVPQVAGALTSASQAGLTGREESSL